MIQFSWLGWATLILVFIVLVSAKGKFVGYSQNISKRTLLIIWFLLPVIIGYAYSVLRNPIIQYSMLIFSTPYIYMLLFSFHKKPGLVKKTLSIVILLVINTAVLVWERDHYNIFYHQPYEELFSTAIIDNADRDVFIIDDCIPYYNEYYFDKFNSKVAYFTKRNSGIDLLGFKEMVSNVGEEAVVTHALTGEELQIVQAYFPYQIGYKQGFTYEIYTFSKSRLVDSTIIKRDIIAAANFDDNPDKWKNISSMIKTDSLSGNKYCYMHHGVEWGPLYSVRLNEVMEEELGIVDVEAEIMMPDTISKALIVASITKGNETVYWTAFNFQEYKPEKGKWTKVYLTADIQSALRGRKDIDELFLKVNIWNLEKYKLLINYINIYSKPGNPNKYSLYYRLNK